VPSRDNDRRPGYNPRPRVPAPALLSLTVRAIYERRVFRTREPIDLPEQSVVEFEPRPVPDDRQPETFDAVNEYLSRRDRAGQHDIAERHYEHQP